ncbi:hypothetical protein Ade02nite_88400 [Paractinoplanes deccanensis]|uniref:Uncharacterized protein n=1 Tax=Paractinoplanes deccanensis TaxID=113561 RepID=A0ABQ3YJL8_9ACTN|nr:hypothetical protein [Actinoplanes deccanensis]GID80199.1 hypothetical protein Ade02nite_88400 [Actinoplanes deccanensis]
MTAVRVDPTGLDAELLDCYDDNLQVLARHAGAADVRGPFFRDWGFTAEGPEFSREPVERRLREDTGLTVAWHPPLPSAVEACAALLAEGRPVLAMGDAYDMPWLPYAGHAHMTHSFVVDAIDGGTAGIADAYHNDTAWGSARPGRTEIDTARLAGLLGADARIATLEPAGPAMPLDPAEVMRANAEALDVSALRDYADRIRRLDDRPGTEELALACWLGVRSRTRYGRWLAALAERDPAVAPVADRFRDEVVPAWRRASERAYIARQRAERGRAVPAGAFDALAGPVADAEAAAAGTGVTTGGREHR